MKNLENYGVQELCNSEMETANGGGIVGLMIFAYVAGYAYEKYVIQ